MNDVIETADALHASANRLYWHSSDPVEELATRLGMSCHAFHGSIQPASAGVECADCGEGMVFANRVHRAQGSAHCPACGATATVEVTPAAAAEEAPAPLAAPRKRDLLRNWFRDLSYVRPQRAAMIGGAAALGLATALLAGEVVRGGH
ncbi:MAG TPA: hypothetical protein VHG91_00610 [Longimicrobium sp.]|nr:hypothetical protein [Longimicrobium sp.]